MPPIPARRPVRAVALVALSLLTAAACSSSSSSAKAPATPGASPSSSAAPAASASATPTAVAAFPTVTGSYGTKPTLIFPPAKPMSTLQVKVLKAGTGPVLNKNDLMVADYLGQIWRGKVFSNTYDNKEPFAAAVGVGATIPGWDKALVGKRTGSRLLLVIPPADGYGASGNSAAGISGTDTLTFVIDVVSRYTKADVGDKSAVPQQVSTAPVTVTGALATRPKIVVAKGAALPKQAKIVVLAKSKGAPLKAGFVILQYEAVYFDGTLLDSTFVRGQPQGVAIGSGGTATPFDGLVGVPIGSRVLVTTPATDSSNKQVGLAIVADIVAQSGPAKAS